MNDTNIGQNFRKMFHSSLGVNNFDLNCTLCYSTNDHEDKRNNVRQVTDNNACPAGQSEMYGADGLRHQQ